MSVLVDGSHLDLAALSGQCRHVTERHLAVLTVSHDHVHALRTAAVNDERCAAIHGHGGVACSILGICHRRVRLSFIKPAFHIRLILLRAASVDVADSLAIADIHVHRDARVICHTAGVDVAEFRILQRESGIRTGSCRKAQARCRPDGTRKQVDFSRTAAASDVDCRKAVPVGKNRIMVFICEIQLNVRDGDIRAQHNAGSADIQRS